MSSGVYKIDPDALGEFIEVFCDQKTAGGGWTVFQRRQDGSVDFWRGWKDYKRGFGNLKGEFWLGLDNINRLTASSSNELRVDLEDNHGKRVFAEYSSFAVASERAKYQLSLGSHTGKFPCNWFDCGPVNVIVLIFWTAKGFIAFSVNLGYYLSGAKLSKLIPEYCFFKFFLRHRWRLSQLSSWLTIYYQGS